MPGPIPPTPPIERALVVARPPLVGRLISTFSREGVETVAAFSEADADLPHLDEADYAAFLPAGADPRRVVAAAMDAGCDAIHPGHGGRWGAEALLPSAQMANLAVIGAPAVLGREDALRGAGLLLRLGDPPRLRTVVVCDGRGAAVHLGELVVAAPAWLVELGSGLVPESIRERVGPAAVALARALSWRGVGTIDWSGHASPALVGVSPHLPPGFELAELQHGVELIAAQLAIAQGMPLGWEQADCALSGHAIAARILHVDPRTGERPSGALERLDLPPGAQAVAQVGQSCSAITPPVLATVCVQGPTRSAALAALAAHLDAVRIAGVTSNVSWLREIARSEALARGPLTNAELRRLVGPA